MEVERHPINESGFRLVSGVIRGKRYVLRELSVGEAREVRRIAQGDPELAGVAYLAMSMADTRGLPLWPGDVEHGTRQIDGLPSGVLDGLLELQRAMSEDSEGEDEASSGN